MKIKKIKIGSRASRLALAQVQEVINLLEKQRLQFPYEIITFETQGDKDKVTPLTTNISDDFFTDSLDQALLEEKIDVAIHSAKDLPKTLREGLSLYALTASLDDTDAFVGKSRLPDLKPGAIIGTSSFVRMKAIATLNPQLKVISIRGSIEERLNLVKNGQCDGIIVATCALKRLGLEKEIKEILPFETTPLQGQLAIVGCRGHQEMENIFSTIDVRKKYGRVFLVGAGPGDPDLITIKAIKTLKKADCIFYDFLISQDLLKYAPFAEKIYVGKRKGNPTLSQDELNRLLKQKAMVGFNVVRLKGGDPLIFGRGAEEIEYVRSYHIKTEIIPGISSATGIPSGLGIPLTARGISSNVSFISGHGEEENERSSQLLQIPKTDTIVFLMGLTKLNIIVQSLRKADFKDTTPVIAISKGTRLDEKIVLGTIQNIELKVREEKLEPPVLIIAGNTVKFFQGKEKKKDHILYLGTNPEKYKSLGHIVHHPMIEITPMPLIDSRINLILNQLSQIDMILLTSRYGVSYFFNLLIKKNFPMDKLQNIDFAVIGEDTGLVLEQNGFQPKIKANEETSEGLLQVLERNYDLKGKRILFPRSSLPNPYLKEELAKRGSEVWEWPVYQNVKPEKRDLPPVKIDKILFTSPSTVKNFLLDYQKIPKDWQILCKGKRTQEYLKEVGYEGEILVFD